MKNEYVFYLYFLIINLITFCTFGADKWKAKRHMWRIPEAHLLLLAVAGGSIGACMGMRIFHHKTRKMKFCLGCPAILAVQILLFFFIKNRYLI